MAGSKSSTSKGPTPKKGSQRDRQTGGTRTTSRAALLRRYTAPVPRESRKSPPWYGYAVLAVILVGLAIIVLNYMSVLPGSTNNWYLLGGLGLLLVSFVAATRWR